MRIPRQDNSGNIRITKKEYNQLRHDSHLWEGVSTAFKHTCEEVDMAAKDGFGNILLQWTTPAKHYLAIDVGKICRALIKDCVPVEVIIIEDKM